MLIHCYPAIKKAALSIAYDNGMINRDNSEEQYLACVEEVLKGGTWFLAQIEACLQVLSDEDLDTVCCGDEEERKELLKENSNESSAEHVEQFLQRIFES